jgi:hypothetical protein
LVEQTAYQDWAWVRPMLSLGFCLTVAHGLDPQTLADRLGVAPEREVLRRDEAVDWFGVTEPVVRVGRVAGWAFAFQEYGAEAGRPDALRAAAVGTEAVTVWRTASALGWFGYARDGEIVVAFELDSPHRRTGSAPQELVDVLARVGLPTEQAWPARSPVSPVLPGLALLTAVSGVRLTGADLDGPLLTGEITG